MQKFEREYDDICLSLSQVSNGLNSLDDDFDWGSVMRKCVSAHGDISMRESQGSNEPVEPKVSISFRASPYNKRI